MKKTTIRFRTAKLNNASKEQILDYYNSRKKQTPRKQHAVFSGCFSGELHFWY